MTTTSTPDPTPTDAPAPAPAEAAPAPAPAPAEAAPADPLDGPSALDAAGAQAAEPDKPAEGADDNGDKGEPVPDETPFEGLKPPEGFAGLDAEALKAATPILRAMGVDTPEKAQGAIDRFAPVISGMVDKAVKASGEQLVGEIVSQRKAWADEVLADPVLSAPQEMAHVARFRDTFLDEATRTFMTESGLGNHPGLLRAFYAAGKAIGEGSFHTGGDGAQNERPSTVEERMYPHMFKKPD